MTIHAEPKVSLPDGPEAGSTLPELMVALCLLAIMAGGLLSMQAAATKTTENYGHLSSRTTEYAQDKMEQLLALAYGDAQSDTTVFPAGPSGGTGLAVGGSVDLAAPVAGYVDYLDQDGNLVTSGGVAAPNTWYYIRVWKVTNPSTNLKQVTVTVGVKAAFAGGQKSESSVTALKSFPF